MTDKEKAEDYTRKNIDLATSMYNPNAEKIALHACLYGLAEGRKEGASEMSRHILEELKKHSIYGTELIRDIIKNLGVEV